MIYKELFDKKRFIDRYFSDKENAVDIIIPIMNTTELFEQCIGSFYKEIPIHTLFIGDGGCNDNSLIILSKFPRVEIIDCKKYKTLGFCIKKLIESVTTATFLYLHSDALLPDGWYDSLCDNKGDWVESRSYALLMACYIDEYENSAIRAFSGAQMGNTRMLQDAVASIEDDYLYRNEDIVIRELVEAQGGVYRRSEGVRYYHTQIYQPDRLKNISISKRYNKEKEVEMLTWQIRGILKYCKLKPYLLKILAACFINLIKTKVKHGRM